MSLQFNEQTQIAPTPTVPVSVVMIVKDCPQSLQKCLSSLRRNFLRDTDELLILDTGSRDNGETEKVARSFQAKYHSRPDLAQDIRPQAEKWLPSLIEKFNTSLISRQGTILDFAAARQIATDLAAHDIQLWIDSDDELVERTPGTLRDLTDKVFALHQNADSIFLDYLYGFDQHDGGLTTILKRERVYDRRKYHWVGRCHETCIPRDGVDLKPAAYFSDAGVAIRHCKSRDDNWNSDLRNYVILRTELEETRGKEDPRTIFYCGNAARGLRLFSDALNLYNTFVPLSGSRDDIYSAVYYAGIIHLSEDIKRPFDALDYMFRAIRIIPSDPRAYFGVARAYYQMGRHQESLHWFRVGRLLPEPTQSLHSYDPQHVTTLPLQIAILAAKELGLQDLVIDFTTQLNQQRPNHPDTRALSEVVQNWLAGRNLVESVRRVAANCAPGNQTEAIRCAREIVTKLPVLPTELEDMGLGKVETNDDRIRDIVFYCGPTAEPWGVANRKSGIGGSEKMVLEMAPRLATRGRKVVVYANIPLDQRGVHEDVIYRHWSEFDPTIPRNVVVFWRQPAMLEMRIPCRKRIVWCHDVQRPGDWTDLRINLADEVWVMSEWQATTLGSAREKLGKKVWVTRNGLDRKLFVPQTREKRVVYCSSPERGLLTALRIFKKADIPDATFHAYYGFNRTYLYLAAHAEYGHFPDMNRTVNYYDYMKLVFKEFDNDDRLVFHGRLGFEDMAKELCRARVWLYPTRFDEISCMAAMEAQAAGLSVVTTDKAALDETIDWTSPFAYCITIDDEDEAAGQLRYALEQDNEDQRQIWAERAQQRFDFERLADEWLTHLVPAIS